jgi:hypothetical protein
MKPQRFLLAALLPLFSSVCVAQFSRDSDTKSPTLTHDYVLAKAVVLAHIEKEPQLDNGIYYTDVTIDKVVKAHVLLNGKQVLRLKRKIEKSESQFLLFCDIDNDKIDAYRGVEVPPKSDVLKFLDGAAQFLEGAVPLKDSAISEWLRYCFDYLNSDDAEVARDAYVQFITVDYKYFRAMAKKLPADKIAGWLKERKTLRTQDSLLCFLLGHCGKAEHANLLRTMFDLGTKNSSQEEFMIGYAMLAPQEALSLMKTNLRDEKMDFLVRYSCLKSAMFLRDHRPDLIPANDLTGAVALLMKSEDMADYGIEYLRESKAWSMTDQVLALRDPKTKEFSGKYIKRAVLRFALSSPEPRAAAFVKEMRERDAQYVADTEELLKLFP